MQTIRQQLYGNRYPGRGILLGKSADGRSAVLAYFIMGRSEKSRARKFVKVGEALETWPLGSVEGDASLIVYRALHTQPGTLIIANGSHGARIAQALQQGGSVRKALEECEYEPDPPHYTPRISGVVRFEAGNMSILLSLLKNDGTGRCLREHYEYACLRPGTGYLLHTYAQDGDPLPSFAGTPALLTLPGDIRELTETLWESLDPDNRISLYVRCTDINAQTYTECIINGKEQ